MRVKTFRFGTGFFSLWKILGTLRVSGLALWHNR